MTASVLLIADHKWRDLASLALLKVILEDVHGVPARIVNYTFWDAAILAFKPAVVCPTTQTGPREQAITRIAHASGARTVVIPTEGIPTAWKVMPVLACAHVDLSHVDRWFTWNNIVRDYMIEHTAMTPDRVVTTGASRFDFYREPLRHLLSSRDAVARRYGLPEGRPLVTWATNFAHAGYVSADTDFIQNDWETRGLTAIPGFASARAYAEADLRSMRDAQGMMLEVFATFPHANFLIKTHPAERLDLYVEYLERCRAAGVRNVALVSREYIGDLLNESSVMIHRYCTTGLEAWMLGIPTLNLHLRDWHAHPEGGGALGDAAKVDHRVSTTEDIVEGLSRYLAGRGIDETTRAERERVLATWLSAIDGRATERQAEAIAACLRAGVTEPRRNPLVFGRRLLGASKRLGHMAVNTLRGRAFDEPLRTPRRHAGIEVNALGYADRLTRQPDVDRWCDTIRALRRAGESRGRPTELAANVAGDAAV